MKKQRHLVSAECVSDGVEQAPACEMIFEMTFFRLEKHPAITLCAYNPKISTNPIPMLFVTGNKDTVASPNNILSALRNFETSMPKAFAKFNNLAHGDITNGRRYHAPIARYTAAWSEVFLADVPAYDTYISGDEVQKQVRDKTVFAQATDYIFKN